MRELPTGTVTFFFSDIEGSTRLAESIPDRYPELLDRHRQIIREAFSRFDGHEVNTEGDSFFAAFTRAQDALEASITIQREMLAEPWPPGAELRVRIGLHTGEGRVVDDDYVGVEVHRAARIMAAAYGGQILISDSTRSLAMRGAEYVTLRDLGEHALRDLSERERLFQVWAPGVPEDSRAPRTLDSAPNNLPTPSSPLIGRDLELGALRGVLAGEDVRLVTLIGPGGIGKTRLATEAAADVLRSFPDGAFFVDLAAARTSDAAVHALVEALDISVPGAEDLRVVLTGHLRNRQALLVLDNFEQVMSLSDDVAALLRDCPRLKVLVTSREPLRVRGERVYALAPLSLPADLPADLSAEDASRYAAVQLFVERARDARADFELTNENAQTVAELAYGLDGLPLAIELAAARLRLFSVDELRDRLRSRLDVLRGGARDLPERQRTLRDTVEWSYELLSPDERSLFALMAVFPSARLDDVEAVAARVESLATVDAIELVESLVDKSMVRAIERSGARRLAMLGVIRDYATEHLERDASFAAAVRLAHAVHYADLSDAQRPALQAANRQQALDLLAAEKSNLQVAWRHLLSVDDVSQLARLLDPLWLFYEARGWYHELVTMTNDLLAVMANKPKDEHRAEKEITLRLTLARGLLAVRGYTSEVEQLYREAVELSEKYGALPRRLPILRSLASFHLYRGELDKALAMGEKLLVLAEQENDPSIAVEGHLVVGENTVVTGSWDEGFAHLEKVVELFDPERDGRSRFRLGPSPGVAAHAVIGLFRWVNGALDMADRHADEAVTLARRLNHPYSLAYASFHRTLLYLWNVEMELANGQAQQTLAVAEEHDYGIWKAVGLAACGVSEVALGQSEIGLAHTATGLDLYSDMQTPPIFWPQMLGLRGWALTLADRPREGLDLLEKAHGLTADYDPTAMWVNLHRASALLTLGDHDTAEDVLWQTLDAARALGARSIELAAATRLVNLPARRGDAAVALRAVYESFTEGSEKTVVRAAAAALADPAAAAL